MDQSNAQQEMTDRSAGGPVERAEGTVRRLWLAGLGAMALACDSANQTFDRLVDRGEKVQADLQGTADEARQQTTMASNRAEGYLRSSMDRVLTGLNLPSKTDVDAINLKLNTLARRLDDIQLQRGATPPEPDVASSPVPPDEDLAT